MGGCKFMHGEIEGDWLGHGWSEIHPPTIMLMGSIMPGVMVPDVVIVPEVVMILGLWTLVWSFGG
jgi:hypothetical protein